MLLLLLLLSTPPPLPGPAALQAGYQRRLAPMALTYFSSKFPVLNHGCTVLSYTHGHAGVSPAHLL